MVKRRGEEDLSVILLDCPHGESIAMANLLIAVPVLAANRTTYACQASFAAAIAIPSTMRIGQQYIAGRRLHGMPVAADVLYHCAGSDSRHCIYRDEIAEICRRTQGSKCLFTAADRPARQGTGRFPRHLAQRP
jgi:hypothetical protein